MEYLTEKVEETKARRTVDSIHKSTNFVISSHNQSTITPGKDLETRIIDMIYNPNGNWRQVREHYLMT